MSNKKNHNIMDDISNMASSTVTTMVNMKKDIANIVAEQIKAFMARMDFVTKAEFDALKKAVQNLSEGGEGRRPARSFTPGRGAPRRGDSQKFGRDTRSGSRSFVGARSGSRSESRFDGDKPERERSERGESRFEKERSGSRPFGGSRSGSRSESRFDRDKPERARSERGESRFEKDGSERGASKPRKAGASRPFAKKSDFDSRSDNRSEKRRPKLSTKPRRSAAG